MFNKEFLKNLTLLYVEDEDAAREQFGKYLKRLFKEVILAKNGQDGFEKFQASLQGNQKIDLILSDINMPILNGIEMLEKIRELDEEVPVMYTTARTETEYLQKAIELNVNHYVLKPIDLDDVVMCIQKVCEKKYYQSLIDAKNSELRSYLTIINGVAAIFKMNDKGEVTFVNELFSNLMQTSKDDLLKCHFQTLFHPEVSTAFAESLWEEINQGETFSDDIKYLNKEGETYFIRSTIFKIVNESGFEFISVGFLSTDEVTKQRDFHKKVISTISSNNLKVSQSKGEVEKLLLENQELSQSTQLLKEQQKSCKNKVAQLKSQVDYFENELLNIDRRLEKRVAMRNQELNQNRDSLEQIQRENTIISDNNSKMKDELDERTKLIQSLEHRVQEKQKRVEALNDLLEHRESQLRKINPKLLE